MIKETKWILLSIVAIFLAYGLVPTMSLGAEEPGFHCSLGMDGRDMAEVELRLSEDGSALHYRLEVHHIEDITMAHLHLGRPGEIGSPVAWLYPAGPPPELIPGLFKGILARGTITGDDFVGPLRGKPLSSLIAEIRAGNVYVNIHTQTYARGEICGPVYLTDRQRES